jgi:hypothetical protein
VPAFDETGEPRAQLLEIWQQSAERVQKILWQWRARYDELAALDQLFIAV